MHLIYFLSLNKMQDYQNHLCFCSIIVIYFEVIFYFWYVVLNSFYATWDQRLFHVPLEMSFL